MRTGGYGLGLIAYHDIGGAISRNRHGKHCLLYTSDAADE